jgi:SpoVK/Ycf46/Vps4 family AAA+-type ATPase
MTSPRLRHELQEIIQRLREVPELIEEWASLETASPGTLVLFDGPNGTGKTKAAEMLAKETGRELSRVDLDSVVSKYIGETEKNLRGLFETAADRGAILFFDEADALFGKRGEAKDAHDRYANLEVGYLLQALENYRGLAIIALSDTANLGDAFRRRPHFVIEFPLPETEE